MRRAEDSVRTMDVGGQVVLSLAILSSISLGIADYLGGVALRRDGRNEAALTYAAVASVVGVLIIAAVLPVRAPESFQQADVLWSFAAGIAFGFALPLLMVGMARGPIAVVAPVLGLVSLAVPAVAGPLLGDHLSNLELAGLLIAVPATVLVAATSNTSSHGFSVVQAVLMGTVIGALLGSAAVFFGQTNPESDIAPALVAQVTATVFLFGIGASTGRLLRPTRSALRPALAVGLLAGLAVLLSVLAYQRGPIAIVAAVIGLAPGPTVLLAWLLMKERINRVQAAGFVLGIGAVLLFAFG